MSNLTTLPAPPALVGRTIAAVTQRELIARDMHGDYVQWTAVQVTTTDGHTITFAVDDTDVMHPFMPVEVCARCGDTIVKEDGQYVHPFSYSVAVQVHDPIPVPPCQDVSRAGTRH